MIVRIVVFGRKMDLVAAKENGVIPSILTIKKVRGNGNRLGQAEGSEESATICFLTGQRFQVFEVSTQGDLESRGLGKLCGVSVLSVAGYLAWGGGIAGRVER